MSRVTRAREYVARPQDRPSTQQINPSGARPRLTPARDQSRYWRISSQTSRSLQNARNATGENYEIACEALERFAARVEGWERAFERFCQALGFDDREVLRRSFEIARE